MFNVWPFLQLDDEDDEDQEAWKKLESWKKDGAQDPMTCSKCGSKKKLLDSGLVTRHYYCPNCKE